MNQPPGWLTYGDPCLYCDEPLHGNVAPGVILTSDGRRYAHVECSLRTVVGGIGHLIAHDYWCTTRRDPDAGLTYRQSALLVMEWVRVVGLPGPEEPADPAPLTA